MIYKKLLDFQKLGVSIKKTQQNTHFKKEYADLNEVFDKVKKPLNEMGVVIIPQVTKEGVQVMLYDTDDDTYASSFVPFVPLTDMQKLGGAITYAKRYGLVALLALEDEDDDGNTASGHDKQKSVKTAPTNSFTI